MDRVRRGIQHGLAWNLHFLNRSPPWTYLTKTQEVSLSYTTIHCSWVASVSNISLLCPVTVLSPSLRGLVSASIDALSISHGSFQSWITQHIAACVPTLWVVASVSIASASYPRVCVISGFALLFPLMLSRRLDTDSLSNDSAVDI